ncbi:DUF1963 domain-containing protein [Amycolatopsis japonica]|uniref:DUF1963 domain-containing protein n=1 Tax=Amycolatopsis japonica TaxID=208439 RepID=UPI003323F634
MSHEYLGAANTTWLSSLVLPAVRLTPALRVSGRSRFGGDPVLPPGTPWPCEAGVSLTLLAVVDLTQAHRTAEHLPGPQTGLLNIFYDLDHELAGEPDGPGRFRLMWPSDSDARRARHTLSPPGEVNRLPETAVTPNPRLTLPDPTRSRGSSRSRTTTITTDTSSCIPPGRTSPATGVTSSNTAAGHWYATTSDGAPR